MSCKISRSRSVSSGSADRLFSFQEGILALAETVWVDVDVFRRLVQSARG